MSIFSSEPGVSGDSLNGHLHLRCAVRPDGVPYLAHQSFRVPIHISKSHVNEGALVLNVVNPTAGFFDGDKVKIDVEVGRGAALVLSTPSASRVYPTRSGKAASNFQHFRVSEDASLEWIPEPFIPHAGACYRQQTRIDLAEGAGLLFFDWIAPGRVARGEVFAYRNLRWELDLKVAERLIARERYDLCPGNDSLAALKARFPQAHYLSIYVGGEFSRNWPAIELDALNGEDVYLGHGPMPAGVGVIRAVCRDSLSARKTLESLRRILYASARKTPPKLGRIFL